MEPYFLGSISTPAGSLWVEQKLFFTMIDELQAFVFSIGCIAWFGLVIFFRHCGSVWQNQSESELIQKLDSDTQLEFIHSIKLQ